VAQKRCAQSAGNLKLALPLNVFREENTKQKSIKKRVNLELIA